MVDAADGATARTASYTNGGATAGNSKNSRVYSRTQTVTVHQNTSGNQGEHYCAVLAWNRDKIFVTECIY